MKVAQVFPRSKRQFSVAATPSTTGGSGFPLNELAKKRILQPDSNTLRPDHLGQGGLLSPKESLGGKMAEARVAKGLNRAFEIEGIQNAEGV